MDYTLNWMLANLPREKWTLENYVSINWAGEKTVQEVEEDGELASELPEELYLQPLMRLIQ